MSSSDEDLTMETNDTQHEDGAPSSRKKATAARRRASKRSAVGGRVEHFTVAERTARGKATRAEVSRRSHGDWEPAASSPRPGRAARGAGEESRARARADSLRPHARLAVHVLPRRRVPDGVRSRERAAGRRSTRSSAATRTSRTSAASPRPTASSSSASTTSTRRCPARSSGTSSGSSRASPSPGAIAASTRSSGRRSTSRSAAPTGRASATFSAMSNLELWYSRIDVDDLIGGDPSAGDRRT